MGRGFDVEAAMERINSLGKDAEKVLKHLTADAKKRGPGWISKEITKVYGAKKGDISGNKIGKVIVQGKNFKDVKIAYEGRPLTHTHFSMSPKTPKEGGTYTLKATAIKGQRKTLGQVKKLTKKQRAVLGLNFTRSGQQNSEKSPIMLMRANGGQYLPFQRKSHDRKDVEVIRTVSLPQMVSGNRTKVFIQAAIDEGLTKRLEHHMKRYMNKQ